MAVICHPHPLHGGSLKNKVVHQLARTFSDLGAVCVRFNFRGVGESEGSYDEGRGELQDLIAVVDWARTQWPDTPLWLAGFSFGGFIVIQAVEQLRPVRLVTVSPAVNYFPESKPDLSSTDWLMIMGDEDDMVPLADVESWLQAMGVQPQVVVLTGAGHFYHGRLNDLKKTVADYFAQ